MSLTADPFIESARAERDVEHPTVEISALGTFLVEDGDQVDAEHIRTEWTHCWCTDGRHRNEDRDDLSRYQRRTPPGSHPIKAEMYAVIVEEKDA